MTTTLDIPASEDRIDAPPGMFTGALRAAARSRPADVRVLAFRDPATGSSSHLVYDEESRIGVIVDPAAAGGTPDADAPLPALAEAIEQLAIDLQLSLETCSDGGRRSAAPWLARRHGALVVASGTNPALADLVAEEGDEIVAGPLRIEVVSPDHRTGGTRYRIAGRVFPPAEPALSMGRGSSDRRGRPARIQAPDPAAAA
jgi:hypothetical protein